MSKGIAIPRELVVPVVERITVLLQDRGLIRGNATWMMAGSYRRLCNEVHDLDLVVADEAYRDVVSALLDAGLEPIRLKKDYSVVGFVWQLEDVPLWIELYRALPGCFGAEILYATGSAKHNVLQRARAKAKGMKLSNKGLFQDGKIIAGATEEEIFAALGEPYLTPEERDIA